MSRFTNTAKALAIAAGISGGCVAKTDAPPAETTPPVEGVPKYATTPIESPEAEAELATLRALDVVHVGRLLVALPAEATACYGYPCEGWEDAAAAEVARQLPRLRNLTAIASAAMESSPDVAPSAEETAADLRALRELHIVEIGELIVDVPAATPNCYNLVCPEDQDRADAANQARVDALAKIAEDATATGS